MYGQEFDENLLYQGDVVKDLPFPVCPEQEVAIAPGEVDISQESTNNFFKGDPQLITALKYSRTGMIISQNCDIENREFILISPVFEINEKYSDDDHIISLKGQKVKYELYLPSTTNFNESFVDLQLISVIKKEKIDKTKRILVLSDYGQALLQQHLRNYLGRMEVKI